MAPDAGQNLKSCGTCFYIIKPNCFFFDGSFLDPKHATKELVDEVFETINSRSKLIKILAMAKSAMRHNMKKDLEKINVPTCLIWGENDQITPPNVAEEFDRLLPNSKLFWIKQCGHAPMMELPEEFNHHLDNLHRICNSYHSL